MKKSLIIKIIVASIYILISINAKITFADYTIHETELIQYRVYESGKRVYGLYLYLVDDSGWVTEESAVTKIELFDSKGASVGLSPISFSIFNNYIRGDFDVNSATWIYNNTSSNFGTWAADILTPLTTDIYTVKVTTDDMVVHTIYADFNKFEPPAISSKTFQINSDSDGNIYWMWDIPQKLLDLGKSKDIVIRAGIQSYLNNKATGLIFVEQPIYMGFCFIPYTQLQFLLSLGSEIGFFINIRTEPQYIRYYSNEISVKDFSALLEIAPKKSTVVIPLF